MNGNTNIYSCYVYLSVGRFVNKYRIKKNHLTFKIIRPTLLFYIVAATTVYILEKVSPSGPCTPGLGVLSFFLLIPIVVGLLLRNVYLTIKVDKKNLIKVVIHSVAIILLFITMW